jgi:hypothetical protein
MDRLNPSDYEPSTSLSPTHLQVINLRAKPTSSFAKASMIFTDELGQGTLGRLGTVLAILSTVVGGGMVSLPYSFY